MRVITEPTVTTIGVTQFIPHPVYQIPHDGSSAAKLGSFAAKGCYDSFGTEGRSNADNQARIIEERHGSVLEHASISFFIEGITRACSHEIVRHRAGVAYSQRSTRYTSEEDAAIVLEPYLADIHHRIQAWRNAAREGRGRLMDTTETGPGAVSDHELLVVTDHVDTCRKGIESYQSQVKHLLEANPLKLSGVSLRKWARGIARNVLPHALETRMTMTGNIRAWRHFLGMRSAAGAEAEILRLSAAIFPRLTEYAPEHFADFTESEGPYGIKLYTPGTWKV